MTIRSGDQSGRPRNPELHRVAACPSCGERYQVRRRDGALRRTCPGCGLRFDGPPLGRPPRRPVGDLAAELEALRAAAGLDIGEWCARLGLPPQTYLRWRQGGAIPRAAALLALARETAKKIPCRAPALTPVPARTYPQRPIISEKM